MPRGSRLPVEAAALLAAVAALAGCYAPPPTFGELPDFALTAVSSAGKPRPLALADLRGRVWIADFIFTRCGGPCPALSLAMAKLQKELPPEVGLLSFTVDPDRDTPAVLAAYALRFGAEPGRWLLLTGEKKPLLALLVQGFKLPVAANPGAPSEQRVTHSARFVLVDKEGRLRGYFDADDEAALSALKRAAVKLS